MGESVFFVMAAKDRKQEVITDLADLAFVIDIALIATHGTLAHV